MTKLPEIRLLADADMPQVHALYGEAFGNAALARWRERFEWQFVRHPLAKDRPSRLFVAAHGSEILGFLASFPIRLWIDGREYLGLCPCDFFVTPRAQGLASRAATWPAWPTLGQRLVQAYLQVAGPLGTSLVYSMANRRVHERLGYRPVPAQPVYLRPLNIVELGRAALGDGRIAPIAAAASYFATPLLQAFNALTRPRRARGIHVDVVAAAGAEFDEVWATVAPSLKAVFVRDRTFVQWRFFEDPRQRHTVLLARDDEGRPVGYAAAMIGMRRGVCCAVIMDVLADPERSAVVRSLLAGLLARLEAQAPVAAITCLGLHPGIRRHVRRSLYVRPRHLEEPALIWWQGDPDLASIAYDAASWHLSPADGDAAMSI